MNRLWLITVVVFGSLCFLVGVAFLSTGRQLPWLAGRLDGRRRSLIVGLAGLAILLMFGPGLGQWNRIAIDVLGLAGLAFLGLAVILLARPGKERSRL